MPTGFSGVDVMAALVGVEKGDVELGSRKSSEAGCEGRKEDAGGRLQGDWKVFIFVLFCSQRAETTSPVFLEQTQKRGRGVVCEKRGRRAPEPGRGLSLGQGRGGGGWAQVSL